ncbi:hypothetical protein B5E58_07415 [Tyzzerella sp. An114]|uniref:hypothetical protein n=1 Tax=Tyzzerella sp. An114 TaxID=1965545 RepID=UPI000B4470C1|nr:hypothetical protein [Tyzzerella sp. An114]OUQ58438.1 hypothetical protein B5E58_07415 [Tyzzerella sp. An114]HIT72367.1 hypothetical protein [Candidatus Fimicola cottocaccae]
MKYIEEYEFFELESLVKRFIKVIDVNITGNTPDFYNILKRMNRNVEMCIKSGSEYSYELLDLVKWDWNNATKPGLGMKAYYIWKDNYDDRIRINNEIKNIIEDIDSIIYGY